MVQIKDATPGTRIICKCGLGSCPRIFTVVNFDEELEILNTRCSKGVRWRFSLYYMKKTLVLEKIENSKLGRVLR